MHTAERGVESNADAERQLVRRWVKTWRNARPELEAIRRRETAAVSVQEAIRQVFDGMESVFATPARATSGLVEQQMWFTRIRTRDATREPASPASGA